MKRYNISVPSEYQKNGETKTSWKTVGKLIELDDGKKFLDLYMYPTTKFMCFEEREETVIQRDQDGAELGTEDDGAVDVDSIPF